MSSFYQNWQQTSWHEIRDQIYDCSCSDVERVLSKNELSVADFAVLISPAAHAYLEELAQRSHYLTRQRFGYTMQMYAPLYLSNECHNICTYCGFSVNNKIARKTLTEAEILAEANHLKQKGFQHLLLVTGEANRTVGVDYIANAVALLKKDFAHISIEVQPLEKEDYVRLVKTGVHAVLVYQETYNLPSYKKHHPKGKKSKFDYRINCPDRIGQAGAHKIGIGALLGLADWRVDSYYTAMHLAYLRQQYWKTKYAISFPRLRPCSGGVQPVSQMSDAEFVQLIAAYRLLDPEVELSISTRESPHFRNHIVDLGITSMSAASKTQPGGYVVAPQSLEQFETDDQRSTEEVTEMLGRKNIEVVWKDWDHWAVPQNYFHT